MIVVDIISCVLLAVGLFFSFVGVLGFLRMPDVYGRLQASTCIPTMGNICLILGGVVYAIKPRALHQKAFGPHEVFHLFVMGGSLCHFIFMYGYLL